MDVLSGNHKSPNFRITFDVKKKAYFFRSSNFEMLCEAIINLRITIGTDLFGGYGAKYA